MPSFHIFHFSKSRSGIRSTHWAEAKNYNLIVFVLETAPARCISFDDDLSGYPNIQQLAARAWIGSRHYSTYPLSLNAHFSIISSMYPPERGKEMQSPMNAGLMRALHKAGYVTAAYGTGVGLDPTTASVYKALGTENINITDPNSGSAYNFAALGRRDAAGIPFPAARQEIFDQEALQKMLEDLGGWIGTRRHFAAVYIPEIGHGPWADLVHGGTEHNLLNRCRSLIAIQDQWIGRLLDFLRQKGELESTLIVLTGDHGIRTRPEDPDLPSDAIDDYTYHVPLLLYAPGVLERAETIQWSTSHIDIEPSVLDLLGIEEGRDFEQGSPLWDEHLRRRITYFLGSDFFGMQGYHDTSEFFAWNSTIDLVFRSNLLHFTPDDIVMVKSPLYDSTTARLRKLEAYRRRWVELAQTYDALERPADLPRTGPPQGQ
jgi:membrane-anchored protein YejM (alkaline phosphatase superfamily)